MYYGVTTCDGDYISHHQIKGGKWGVLHGPPYPLSRQSPSERAQIKSTNRSKMSDAVSKIKTAASSTAKKAVSSVKEPASNFVKKQSENAKYKIETSKFGNGKYSDSTKKRLIDEGDVEKILNRPDQFNNKDLSDAINKTTQLVQLQNLLNNKYDMEQKYAKAVLENSKNRPVVDLLKESNLLLSQMGTNTNSVSNIATNTMKTIASVKKIEELLDLK